MDRQRASSFDHLSSHNSEDKEQDNEASGFEQERSSEFRRTISGQAATELKNTSQLARQLAQGTFTNSKHGSLKDLSQKQSISSLNNSIQYANEKRNQDLHILFRSIPSDDPLIDDFSCALQREILIQGRLYLTKNHLAFNSNIFGYVTNLIIAFTDILTVERKMTALVIPNAIGITTLHSRFVFSSFLSRENVYQLIMRLWRSSLGDDVDGLPWSNTILPGNSQFSPLDKQYARSHAGQYSDGDDVFSDDAPLDTKSDHEILNESPQSELSKQNVSSITQDSASKQSSPTKDKKTATLPYRASKKNDFSNPESQSSSMNRKVKTQTLQKVSAKQSESVQPPEIKVDDNSACECQQHYKNTVLDRQLNVSLDQAFLIIFKNPQFTEEVMKQQQFNDIQISDWKDDQREIKYLVPLNFAFLPKNTQCSTVQKIEGSLIDSTICVKEVVTSPEIPFSAGSSFRILSSICLTKISSKQCQILITFEIEWIKSNIFKSVVERNAYQGNIQFWKTFELTLLKHIENAQRKIIDAKPEVTASMESFKIEASFNQKVIDMALNSLSYDTLQSIPVLSFLGIFSLVMFLLNLSLITKLLYVNNELNYVLYPPSSSPKSDIIQLDQLPDFWFQEHHNTQNEYQTFDLNNFLTNGGDFDDLQKQIQDLKEQIIQSENALDELQLTSQDKDEM